MHFICVVGTIILMLIPYVISQAINGLRSSAGNYGKLLNCTFDPSIDYGLQQAPEESTGNVTVNCTCSDEAVAGGRAILLQIRPAKSGIMEVVEGDRETLDCGNGGVFER